MSAMFYLSYIALWCLLLLQGGLLILVYRHFGMMALGTLEGVQRDGLPVGAPAPALYGLDAMGETVGWQPRADRAQLLIFVSPDCEPCVRIFPYLNQLALAGTAIQAITPGSQDGPDRLAERFRPRFAYITVEGGEAFNRYRVRVTPFGFIVAADGRVLAKGLCSDVERLRELLIAGDLREAAVVLMDEIGIATAHTSPLTARTEVRA
ncbi:MAG: hypothetical protein HYX51_03340 [Chloroflexi bacterium]|nr:hypothetical protein [Chloroflexota bacterium]